MTLTYRGVRYQQAPISSYSTSLCEIVGQHREAHVWIASPDSMKQSRVALRYRGISYLTA